MPSGEQTTVDVAGLARTLDAMLAAARDAAMTALQTPGVSDEVKARAEALEASVLAAIQEAEPMLSAIPEAAPLLARLREAGDGKRT